MEVRSQSQNDRVVYIPDDTPMLLAEDNKRIRAFRNAANVRSLSGEMFLEGDLWRIEDKAFENLPTVKKERTLGDAIVDAQIFKVNVPW